MNAPQPSVGTATSALTAAWLSAGADTEAARSARQYTLDAFAREFGDLTGWASQPLARRLAASVSIRGFIAWAMLHTSTPVDATYVAAVTSDWGHHTATHYPEISEVFRVTARRIGFTEPETRRQWGC